MDEIKKSTVSTSEANESGIENKETDGLSQRQIIVKRFFKHKAFSSTRQRLLRSSL